MSILRGKAEDTVAIQLAIVMAIAVAKAIGGLV